MGSTLITLVIAIIFSLLPLILGIKKKKIFLAVLGFVATIVISTSMHVFLSVVMAIIFTWLILQEDQEVDKLKEEQEDKLKK
jgi:putative Ca2+/H+ antiporter (TMEM165/GDT1 family)